MTTSASLVLSRPLLPEERAQLTQLDALRLFLLTAPAKWNGSSSSASASSTPPALHRFPLPDGEPVSCVRWRGLFYITGTDVVRALVFRFAAFGRPVRHMKKFEEGVFSDLRNLKPGLDATLEEPKVCYLLCSIN
jgi:transcription factor STE12